MDVYDKLLRYHWLSWGSGLLGAIFLSFTVIVFIRLKIYTTITYLTGSHGIQKIKINVNRKQRKGNKNETTTRLSENKNDRDFRSPPTVFVCDYRGKCTDHQ